MVASGGWVSSIALPLHCCAQDNEQHNFILLGYFTFFIYFLVHFYCNSFFRVAPLVLSFFFPAVVWWIKSHEKVTEFSFFYFILYFNSLLFGWMWYTIFMRPTEGDSLAYFVFFFLSFILWRILPALSPRWDRSSWQSPRAYKYPGSGSLERRAPAPSAERMWKWFVFDAVCASRWARNRGRCILCKEVPLELQKSR